MQVAETKITFGKWSDNMSDHSEDDQTWSDTKFDGFNIHTFICQACMNYYSYATKLFN